MLGTLLLWRFGISLGSRWVFAISLLTAVAFYTLSEVLLWTQGADDHFFEWRLGKMFVGWSFFFVYGFWLRARPTWLGAIVTRRIWWSLAALFRACRDSTMKHGSSSSILGTTIANTFC